jgi:3'-5' exonuclease
MSIDHLKNILFLDIETVACSADYTALSDRLKAQWARKAAFIRKGEATDEEVFHERAAIYAEFGKVIVIGLGYFAEEDGESVFRVKALQGHDEAQLLHEFIKVLGFFPAGVRLCAHNGREFDFPYLCRRLIVQGIPLPQALDLSGKKPWEIPHIDTLEMWKFGDHKHFTSLDLLAAILGVSSSKTDIDGSMVNAVYYRDNDLDKIARYCLQDVVVLAQVYQKLTGRAAFGEAQVRYV